MKNLFLEGAQASIQACSIILLLPAILTSTATKNRTATAKYTLLFIILFSWVRFSGRGAGWNIYFSAAALLLCAFLFLPKAQPLQSRTSLLSSLLIGFASSELWTPCVGTHFGSLLNELPETTISGLLKHATYTIGIFLPALAYIAFLQTIPDEKMKKVIKITRPVTAFSLTIFALAIVFGYHEEILQQLHTLSRP